MIYGTLQAQCDAPNPRGHFILFYFFWLLDKFVVLERAPAGL